MLAYKRNVRRRKYKILHYTFIINSEDSIPIHELHMGDSSMPSRSVQMGDINALPAYSATNYPSIRVIAYNSNI